MSLNEVIKSNDLRTRLEKAGYTLIKDLENKKILSLTKELALSKDEITELVTLIQKKTNNEGITANQLLEEQCYGISLSCQRMNLIFGINKQVPKCSITEISGAMGTGKTTLCMDLALNVQLPISQGGMDGQCIYIDTEGNFSKDRLIEIARHSTIDDIETRLNNIHVFRVTDHIELIALTRQLPSILQDIPKVKLIIIDSMAYLFRFNIKLPTLRLKLLNYVFHLLIPLANNYGVVIVATNHTSTNFIKDTIQPVNVDAWGQWCMQRLVLGRKGHKRFAYQYKPSNQSNNIVIPFIITNKGIEDDDDTWHLINQIKGRKEGDDNELNDTNSLLEKINRLDHDHIDPDQINIWEEQGLSDELISQIPSQLSSGASLVEEEESYVIVPDSQPEHTYSDVITDSNIEDNLLDTSIEPPQPTSNYLPKKRKANSRLSKQHQQQQYQQKRTSSTHSINSHFDKVGIKSDEDDDLNDDLELFKNDVVNEDDDDVDDEWLNLVCASSPPY